MVFAEKSKHPVCDIQKRELGLIRLSGLAIGTPCLCYYKALQDGLVSIVDSIAKLKSIVPSLKDVLLFLLHIAIRFYNENHVFHKKKWLYCFF